VSMKTKRFVDKCKDNRDLRIKKNKIEKIIEQNV